LSTVDKLALIVSRRQDLEKQLSDAADHLLQRYDAAPSKAQQAFAKHHAKLDAEDKSLQDLEHAIDALSNDPLGQ